MYRARLVTWSRDGARRACRLRRAIGVTATGGNRVMNAANWAACERAAFSTSSPPPSDNASTRSGDGNARPNPFARRVAPFPGASALFGGRRAVRRTDTGDSAAPDAGSAVAVVDPQSGSGSGSSALSTGGFVSVPASDLSNPLRHADFSLHQLTNPNHRYGSLPASTADTFQTNTLTYVVRNRHAGAQTFHDLGVRQSLAAKLWSYGVQRPTEIQTLAIPAFFAGTTLYVQAETGTGKTLAYLLPLLTKLMHKYGDAGRIDNPPFRALVIAPTPELAVQIHSDITRLLSSEQNPQHYAQYAQVVIGNVKLDDATVEAAHNAGRLDTDLDSQVATLVRRPPAILIGTPKRLIQVLKHPQFPTSLLRAVEHVVVDEVDNVVLPVPRRATHTERQHARRHPKSGMKVLRHVIHHNPNAQLTFVSATINAHIRSEIHAYGWEYKPTLVRPGRPFQMPALLTHAYALCDTRQHKFDVIERLFLQRHVTSAMLFMNSNDRVLDVCEELERRGVRAFPLYQSTRWTAERRANMFKLFESGAIQVLVATDNEARGLHVPALSHVLILDPPSDATVYLHLAGRTGRMQPTRLTVPPAPGAAAGAAGAAATYTEAKVLSGTVVTLVTASERAILRKYRSNLKIEFTRLEDLPPPPSAAIAASDKRSPATATAPLPHAASTADTTADVTTSDTAAAAAADGAAAPATTGDADADAAAAAGAAAAAAAAATPAEPVDEVFGLPVHSRAFTLKSLRIESGQYERDAEEAAAAAKRPPKRQRDIFRNKSARPQPDAALNAADGEDDADADAADLSNASASDADDLSDAEAGDDVATEAATTAAEGKTAAVRYDEQYPDEVQYRAKQMATRAAVEAGADEAAAAAAGRRAMRIDAADTGADADAEGADGAAGWGDEAPADYASRRAAKRLRWEREHARERAAATAAEAAEARAADENVIHLSADGRGAASPAAAAAANSKRRDGRVPRRDSNNIAATSAFVAPAERAAAHVAARVRVITATGGHKTARAGSERGSAEGETGAGSGFGSSARGGADAAAGEGGAMSLTRLARKRMMGGGRGSILNTSPGAAEFSIPRKSHRDSQKRSTPGSSNLFHARGIEAALRNKQQRATIAPIVQSLKRQTRGRGGHRGGASPILGLSRLTATPTNAPAQRTAARRGGAAAKPSA